MTSRAPGAESATTADETHERLPEVGGACAVEEEARGEIAVVEELDELLPDERLQRQFVVHPCLLYTSPSPRDRQKSRMPSSA